MADDADLPLPLQVERAVRWLNKKSLKRDEPGLTEEGGKSRECAHDLSAFHLQSRAS